MNKNIKFNLDSISTQLTHNATGRVRRKLKHMDLTDVKLGDVCRETLRKVHEHLAHKLTKTVHSSLLSTEAEMQAVADSPEFSILDRTIAKVALEGLKKGKIANLDFLLTRTIGPPRNTLEVTGPNGGAIELQSAMHAMTTQEARKIMEQDPAFRELRDIEVEVLAAEKPNQTANEVDISTTLPEPSGDVK